MTQSNTEQARMSWLNYLKSFVWTTPTTPTPTSNITSTTPNIISTTSNKNPLEESISVGWTFISSELDKIAKLKAKLEKKERDKELEEIQSRKKQTKTKDRLSVYTKLIENCTSEEKKLLQNQLDPNAKASNIRLLVSWHRSSFLKILEQLYLQHFNNNPNTTQELTLGLFKKFEEDCYNETKYQKNIEGSIKDIGFFIYSGIGRAGLTSKTIDDIVTRWSDILSKALSELLGREVTSEESDSIEQTVSEIASPLIRLHIENAKQSAEAFQREGRLGKKWEEEAQKKADKLREIKAKGLVDARFNSNDTTSQDKIIVDTKQDISPDKKKVAELLTKNLHFRIKLDSNVR